MRKNPITVQLTNSQTREDEKTDEIHKILQYQREYKKILATIPACPGTQSSDEVP